MNSLLRVEPLIDVLVPGEYDVDTVLFEERFEGRARLQRGTAGRRRVQGMVEIWDLPVRTG